MLPLLGFYCRYSNDCIYRGSSHWGVKLFCSGYDAWKLHFHLSIRVFSFWTKHLTGVSPTWHNLRCSIRCLIISLSTHITAKVLPSCLDSLFAQIIHFRLFLPFLFDSYDLLPYVLSSFLLLLPKSLLKHTHPYIVLGLKRDEAFFIDSKERSLLGYTLGRVWVLASWFSYHIFFTNHTTSANNHEMLSWWNIIDLRGKLLIIDVLLLRLQSKNR